MESTLHILNGDSTFDNFEESGLDGDALIWREVLSEGPLLENISSAAFWNTRSEWICKTFNETPENYQAGMVDQLGKLNQEYEELNLWFDFDLHCQVNLMGAMALIKQSTDLSEPTINLITSGEFADNENFRGMGQLDGDQLAELFDNRYRLTPYDFELAGEAWEIYVKGDEQLLTHFINDTTFWGSLHLLKPALQAQVKRLQVNANGLNFIEQFLLDIYQRGIRQKALIHRTFWESQRIYGLGDIEIDLYLHQLSQKGLISLQ